MPIFYEWWQSFYGVKASECERCPSRFIKNNYLDQKVEDGEARMGESLCWKQIVTLQVQDTCQNKIFMQNHHVWKMF